MKLGSLFDGSGTCPLAASAVGIIPAWASEIEPFPRAVTQSRFPKMAHLEDITKLDGGKIEPVDVVTFGSPCQNLSIAGNRQGLEGEESSLFLEAVRIIKEMRIATNGKYPQIAMWENVTGAFSSNKGSDFNRVVEELCKICDPDADVPRPANGRWGKAGLYMGDHYSLAWRQLDAQYWGVAQRRKRIFLILDLGGQCAGEILFKREGLRRDFTAVRRTGQAPRRAAGDRLEEHDSCYAVESHPQDKRVSLSGDNIVQTLAGRMGTGGGNVPLIICRATAQGHAESCEDLAPTVTAAAGMSGNNQPIVTVPVSFSQKSYDKYENDGVAPTLKAKGGSYGGTEALMAIPYTLKIRGGCDGGKGALIQEDKSATLACNNDQSLFVPYSTEDGILYLVRKLTPTECASLQGFEKDWCALVEHKDAPEYKMWGNGMAFPCVLYVMEGIAEVLQRRYLEALFGGSDTNTG